MSGKAHPPEIKKFMDKQVHLKINKNRAAPGQTDSEQTLFSFKSVKISCRNTVWEGISVTISDLPNYQKI